jgi:hypothetical protein
MKRTVVKILSRLTDDLEPDWINEQESSDGTESRTELYPVGGLVSLVAFRFLLCGLPTTTRLTRRIRDVAFCDLFTE